VMSATDPAYSATQVHALKRLFLNSIQPRSLRLWHCAVKKMHQHALYQTLNFKWTRVRPGLVSFSSIRANSERPSNWN